MSKPPPEETDRQLLLRAAAGEQPAFAALYRRYGARLHAYFRSRCGNNDELAEDFRQQVFLQLLESRAFRQPASGPESLGPLLFTIAANLVRNHYRSAEREQRRRATYREMRAGDAPATPSEPNRELTAALARLPDHHRACVELRFRRGFTVAEIAEALGVAPGTVKSRLHYGLKKLAEILRQHPVE